MANSPDSAVTYPSLDQNQPWVFWRLLDSRIQPRDWIEAMLAAMRLLDDLPAAAGGTDPRRLVAEILGERQFGSDHWRLSGPKQIYYRAFRRLLPDSLRCALRTVLLSRQRNGFALNWPIEDRYVRFLYEVVARLMASRQLVSVPYIRFWPGGKEFAFILTHDIETDDGQGHVREIAAREEGYGFRSSFNFVPEKYRVDLDLIGELKRRGFEVGVHGLKHDGRLFCSKEAFDAGARRINRYLKEWDAVGFRSPMTHRNPEWMQTLEIEYDLSFFDTDPYEPMPGGTMSIWPFMMGRFVELPYTLSQDHHLMVTLAERTPRLWMEKVEFISRYHGMALLNAHPDYLRTPQHFAIYDAFLKWMSERSDYWHALPREAARWWRARSAVSTKDGAIGSGEPAPGGFDFTAGTIRPADEGGILLR